MSSIDLFKKGKELLDVVVRLPVYDIQIHGSDRCSLSYSGKPPHNNEVDASCSAFPEILSEV